MNTQDLIADAAKSAKEDNKLWVRAINLLQDVYIQTDGDRTIKFKTVKAIANLLDDSYDTDADALLVVVPYAAHRSNCVTMFHRAKCDCGLDIALAALLEAQFPQVESAVQRHVKNFRPFG